MSSGPGARSWQEEDDSKAAAASAGRGSEDRLAFILKSYGTWLRRTLARLCPGDLGIQVDDVEQEVALRLWKALEREVPIDNLTAYLYRIASSATLDAMRKARVRREKDALPLAGEPRDGEEPRAELVDRAASPEQRASQAQLLQQVDSVMATLPEARRRAIRLHWQGFTTAEIGELLGWSEAKARNLLYRGLKALRHGLERKGIRLDLEG